MERKHKSEGKENIKEGKEDTKERREKCKVGGRINLVFILFNSYFCINRINIQ